METALFSPASLFADPDGNSTGYLLSPPSLPLFILFRFVYIWYLLLFFFWKNVWEYPCDYCWITLADEEENADNTRSFEERRHQFPAMVSIELRLEFCDEHIEYLYCGWGHLWHSGYKVFIFGLYFLVRLQELVIREFSFHQLNANLLWPGTFALADWLVQHRSWIEGRRVIELGRYGMRVVWL